MQYTWFLHVRQQFERKFRCAKITEDTPEFHNETMLSNALMLDILVSVTIALLYLTSSERTLHFQWI